MRDPYDVLGIRRAASFDEVKAAYRRACKTKHPDMGGSQEAFVELQNAYEAILTDLKRGYQAERPEPQQDRAAPGRDNDCREQAYRDIDDELDELRRSARAREDALRAMRSQLWEEGDKVAWVRFTWRDITRFLGEITRSGVKGLALLSAALIGIGSVLVEANAVSAIIMLGSGLGFALSQALKSDKGGMLSAGLLLFGIMTIWLPPVRQALVHYPLATISLLLCLALIFKFGQQGGMVGLLTGGLLTLYVIAVILARTPDLIPGDQQSPVPEDVAPPSIPTPQPVPTAPPSRTIPAQPPAPEIRELIASKGAVLKLVAGVAYHLRIRGGFTTLIVALHGSAAPFEGNNKIGPCTDRLDLSAPFAATPYVSEGGTYQACGTDALLRVIDVR